jgi:hypothetical protein
MGEDQKEKEFLQGPCPLDNVLSLFHQPTTPSFFILPTQENPFNRLSDQV